MDNKVKLVVMPIVLNGQILSGMDINSNVDQDRPMEESQENEISPVVNDKDSKECVAEESANTKEMKTMMTGTPTMTGQMRWCFQRLLRHQQL